MEATISSTSTIFRLFPRAWLVSWNELEEMDAHSMGLFGPTEINP
jgi:hypothetical protein